MLNVAQAIQTALQHHQAGRLEQAAAIYRSVLQIQPNQPDALHLLGVIAYQGENYETATQLIERAIRINNTVPDYFNNLGNVLKDQGRLGEAVGAYRRGLALNPQDEMAHYNLGLALQGQDKLEEAIACYRRALALRPGYPDAHNALGNALKDQGRLEEAVAAYQRAIALKPDFPHAHNNLGIALQTQGKLDEAISSYQRALSLNPEYAEAYNNLGLTFYDQGRAADARGAYRRALAIKPQYASAHLNYALTLLLQGNFSEGWKEYEWRFESNKEVRNLKSRFRKPLWQGEALAARRILLYSEQGLGDTLQFVRYAPLVAQRGGRVFIECQPELKRLLKSVTGIEEIIGRGEPLPDFDLHCSLLSLPLAIDTRLDTIPAAMPYLQPEPHIAAYWKEKIGSGTGLKVGLVWAGSSREHNPRAHIVDRRRSIALSQFEPLTQVPGVRWFSVQKGEPASQAKSPPQGLALVDYTGELRDFADTAGLVANLDLMITVDTSVAHLAGAMAKPVWMLSRLDGCWRWLLEREDSPWYPSMRIFRQHEPGNWADVISRVAAALLDMRRAE